MKVKLLTTISFFTYQLSIAQTEKLLHGKVVSQDSPLVKVEIINKTTKISTTTNDFGEFSIPVNVKDSLIFFSKEYFFRRIQVSPAQLYQNNLVVNMVIKPLELDEVVVSKTKLEPIRLSKQDIREIKLNSHKSAGSNDGPIPNGIDFVRIGKELYYLLAKEKETKPQSPPLDFKKFIKTSIAADFFTTSLKLRAEEKELFIEFCDADPHSKKLLEHPNILRTMDFLYAKTEEFIKLKTEPKN
jgi:hypothetical protein